MLASRYRYRVDKNLKPVVIGSGAFSQVYEGVDVETGRLVAIKVFREGTSAKHMRSEFQRIVDCFIKVHGPLSQRSSSSSLEESSSPSFHSNETMNDILSGDLVVNLLDYSKNESGKPGASRNDNYQYFVVLELGLYTLDDYIFTRGQANRPFSLAEIRSIFWDLTRMVALLHRKSLAHMDIKPQNIMRFDDGRWKLIDMDGALDASTEVRVAESDCVFTPIYCAPELAAAILNKSSTFRISRLVDVWSLGMVMCDFLFLVPLLHATFHDIKGGEASFLDWLADTERVILLPDQVRTTCPDLHDLLQNRMLVKNPNKRWSLPEILAHPFFNPVRRKLHAQKLDDLEIVKHPMKPVSQSIGLIGRSLSLHMAVEGVDFEDPKMIFVQRNKSKFGSAGCSIQ